MTTVIITIFNNACLSLCICLCWFDIVDNTKIFYSSLWSWSCIVMTNCWIACCCDVYLSTWFHMDEQISIINRINSISKYENCWTKDWKKMEKHKNGILMLLYYLIFSCSFVIFFMYLFVFAIGNKAEKVEHLPPLLLVYIYNKNTFSLYCDVYFMLYTAVSSNPVQFLKFSTI